MHPSKRLLVSARHFHNNNGNMTNQVCWTNRADLSDAAATTVVALATNFTETNVEFFLCPYTDEELNYMNSMSTGIAQNELIALIKRHKLLTNEQKNRIRKMTVITDYSQNIMPYEDYKRAATNNNQITEKNVLVTSNNNTPTTDQAIKQLEPAIDANVKNQEHKFEFIYVDENDRFECGIRNCYYKAINMTSYKLHFESLHSNEQEFICAYCTTGISGNQEVLTFEDIKQHMRVHGVEMYGCSFCENSTHQKESLIRHFKKFHKSQPTSFVKYKRTATSTTKIQCYFTYECNTCNKSFNFTEHALDHFKQEHPFETINVTIFEEDTEKNKTASLWIHQAWICLHCENDSSNTDGVTYTKQDQLHHHEVNHAKKYLMYRRSKTVVSKIDETSNATALTTENAAFDRSISYSCFHCEVNTAFDSINCVYEHWRCTHLNDYNDLYKPFQFDINKLLSCAQKDCLLISTYSNLKRHHNNEHSGKMFATAHDICKERCGECDFTTENMDLCAHFEENHGKIIFNIEHEPYDYIDDQFLEQLLKVNMQKKLICYCGQVFNTILALQRHFEQLHKRIPFDLNYDEEDDTTIMYIPHCCNVVKHCEEDALTHIWYCKYSQTRFEDKKFKKAVDNMKIMFANGLTLTRKRLFRTKYSNEEPVDEWLAKQKRIEKEYAEHGCASVAVILEKKGEIDNLLRNRI